MEHSMIAGGRLARQARSARTAMAAAALAALVILAACGTDDPVAAGDAVEVCAAGYSVSQWLAPAEAQRLVRAGGYFTTLTVDPAVTRPDDSHFRRITDAVAAARAIRKASTGSPGCRITIRVLPGTYVGTTGTVSDNTTEQLPLVLDFANVTLQGSYAIALGDDGRPTGAAPNTSATTLTANPALTIVGGTTQTGVSEPLIVVNAENGVGGNDVTVEGFIFRSGHAAGSTTVAGKGILALRNERLVVRGNSFEGNFTERVDLRAGSGLVERNFSTGPGDTCDICIAGPGQFSVRSNTLEQGGIPGILIVPATQLPVPPGVAQFELPPASTVNVEITNNEISHHQRTPVGTGIRIATMGINAPNVTGVTVATVRDNYVHDNRFGFIIEAGFPVAGSRLRGDAIVSTSGNRFVASCQRGLLVSFSRHTTGLGLANAPYLQNSRYTLSLGGDLAWSDAWYANPDGFGNALVVNGSPVSAGRVTAYDAAKVCP